jgi:spore coat polysaccharide biosynthesis protein SpsF (cytidylyltransferase family)
LYRFCGAIDACKESVVIRTSGERGSVGNETAKMMLGQRA